MLAEGPLARLAQKVGLVAGGGTGIGRAIAIQYAREGARVALVGRRSDPLTALAAEISGQGGQALAVPCDVTRAADVQRAVDLTAKQFGRLDVVVNCAGALEPGTAEETSEEQLDRLIAVNLKGTFLVCRAALPRLRECGGGSIINVGSVLSLVGMQKRVAYAAAKGGVLQMSRAMALDHAREGIRVNCICPAIVQTPMIDALASRQSDPQGFLRLRAEQIPAGRLGTPEDVAHLAVFLASDESSWLTGAALPLDGGLTAS